MQTLDLKKILSKIRLYRYFLYIIQYSYLTPKVKTMFNGEIPDAFPRKKGTRYTQPLSLLFNVTFAILAKTIDKLKNINYELEQGR